MSIKIYPLLGLFISIFFFPALSAQETPNVIIEDKTVMFGDIVEFDILVFNYTDIIGATFSVEWDSTHFRYVDIGNIALGLSIDDSFGTVSASGGKIVYLYFDDSLEGNTLPDNAVLFTLKLEVIVEENIITNINFGDALEVVGIEVEDLLANFSEAEITIMTTVNATEIPLFSSFSATVSPNPFYKDAVVLLDISSKGELTWTLSEMSGKLLARGTEQVVAGQQSLLLQNTLFKYAGSYILKLEMEGMSLSRQLIRIEP